MTISLSDHFTLDELTASETAARLGLDNTPSPEVTLQLRETARHMEAVRSLLGDRPITVLSGYRSEAVNNAIGGSRRSQHMTGHAVDFICPRFGTPEDIVRAIAAGKVPFDQCILEYQRWVHLSFSERHRLQVLEIDRHGTRAFSR